MGHRALGEPPALRARAGQPNGPKVAILAEYDALPGIGHACGHNLIAAGAVGAFLAAAEVAEQAGGEVITELDRVRLIVERCARGAAIASDVEVRSEVRQGYRAMKNNLTLARCFGSHLEVLDRPAREVDTRLGAGSTDMGDVSQVIPAIHPGLAIINESEAFCHEPRFATAAGSDQGLQTALLAAKALARTAIEVICDGVLREAIQAEWLAQR